MATIINNPSSPQDDSSSGMGIVIGTLFAILLIILFVVYVLPTLRSQNSTTNTTPADTNNINVTIPLPTASNSPKQQ